jgi:ribosomal protein S18
MSSESTTAEQKPVSNWKDPEWVRKFYREKRRQERGLKRHPNILDDGTRWSDAHPWGRFETEEELKEYKKKYQKPAPKRPKKTCDICQKEVYEAKWWVHEKSIDHVRNVQLLNRFNVSHTEQTAPQQQTVDTVKDISLK